MAMVAEFARPTEDWRIKPAYTAGQAARLAGVSAATVRRWLFGYEQPGHQMEPVFGGREDQETFISFLELAEIVVAAGFRHRGLELERLRRAREYSAAQFGLDYPFATLKMKKLGPHVIHEFENLEKGSPLLVLDLQGQLTLPWMVAERLDTFDFVSEWASRWFPAGRGVPIVVDPQMGGGKPTVAGRGVTIEAVMRRFTKGQQSITYIASDFSLPRAKVESIIQYATAHRSLLAA